jgi:hypothetical protein
MLARTLDRERWVNLVSYRADVTKPEPVFEIAQPMQEITSTIAEILAQHHFWRKYTACPWPITDSEGPYFTMLLYQKGAFSTVEPCRTNRFSNSRMSMLSISSLNFYMAIGFVCRVLCRPCLNRRGLRFPPCLSFIGGNLR